MNSVGHLNANISFDERESIEAVQHLFQEFLETFVDEKGEKYYHIEAQRMFDNKRATMYVNVKHIFKENFELIEPLIHHYHRYEPAIRKAVQNFLYSYHPEYAKQKLFSVGFFNLYDIENIRGLKTNRLGKLVAVKGTVTKTTEVRPELVIGKFTCSVCNADCGLVDQQFRFTEPKMCPSKACNNRVDFELQREESLYVDWQKIKVQESASDLPSGSMPRSIEVILRNEQVERAQPGDRVVFIGALVVVPDAYSMLKPGEKYEMTKSANLAKDPSTMGLEGVSGIKALGIRDLNHRMVFLANNVHTNDTKMSSERSESHGVDEEKEEFTEAERDEFESISKIENLFDKMTSLIAPSVLGNIEVKKGILLMLFGGVNKTTPEGMKLRGDINICLVGDPSTAKSQFLKFVHNFVPRTVYTSGRGSTAAGLTASLNRDPETGEFTIEAGALLLADNGICCIDEFDKMNDNDVVAIHEAMEQQTISLTKAGIQASLNARASILAALNPILGRYDKTKTLKFNVNLAPPLMSRFDLFFVLIDECDEKIDEMLAKKLVQMHMRVTRAQETFENSSFKNGVISSGKFKRYLKFAKQLNPEITKEAAVELKNAYVKMRVEEMGVQKSSYRITVRQLESLIRLSEAIAKVHCSIMITVEHVREARKLLNESIMKIYKPDYEMEVEELGEEANATPENDNQIVEENGENKITEEPVAAAPKVKVKISSEEYERVSKTFIYLVKTEGSLEKEYLVLKFIETDIENVTDQEELLKKEKLARSILSRMIKLDKVFIEYTEKDNNQELQKIAFHPRYTDS